MRSCLKFITIASLALAFVPSSAFAQSDPTQIGGGQLPYILIVMDTSASTEWTDAGDETYPERDPNDYATPPFGGYPFEFTPGDFMSIGVSGQPEQADGPDMFGPCVVWEPDQCNEYDRPAWTLDAPSSWTRHYSDSSLMNGRVVSYLRDDVVAPTRPRARLKESSQPRHVTIKEILTGDMILMTETQRAAGTDPLTLDPDDYGPGCWFVPRQRGATIQKDPIYCEGFNEFEEYPDHDAPFPHFQEVYDAQRPNGLLDSLSGAAIFAFAAFDGYPRDMNWDDNLNDRMRGNSPTAPFWRESADPTESDNCDWVDENGNAYTSDCYDLGIYKVVGPKDLQIPSAFLGELSSYTQVAIRDSGFLSRNSGGDFELDPKSTKAGDNPWLGVRFSKGFDKYVDKFNLGKQPIARGTPLAAAIHDVHQFFREGQDGMEPIQTDTYAQCRQKHVVLITDGFPEPERGIGVGSNRLNPAFGYYEDRYTYSTTEGEILAMRADSDNMIPPAGTGFNVKYSPRTHVVGIKDEDADEQVAVLDKLNRIAINGQTCAQYYLSPDWYGTTKDNCARATAGVGACIDTSRPVTGYSFMLPDGTGNFPCRFPAVVLNTDDPGQMQAALSEIFNGIIGNAGVASRTRAVVSPRLDNVNEPSGGQYRFFSGVQIGGSPYWGGIINRQTIPCDGGPATFTSVHDEIDAQVNLAGVEPRDSRRIFTSMPDETTYDYNVGSFGFNSFPNSGETFFAEYEMDNISTDEFGVSSMPLETNTRLEGKRIPLEADFVYAGGPSGMAESDKSILFNVADKDEFADVVDNYRGRILEKQGRALNGILNGNPVVVGPPDLDLPSESYRAYKARHGDRPTMLYVPTMDGLLHAIHTGENQGRIKERGLRTASQVPTDTASSTNTAADQREAWAYMPFMFLREIATRVNSQPYLMDGTPAVKDVRLCHQNPDYNSNTAACESVCKSCGAFPAERQWRSVLVQGLGLAGTGYFALDVTRPGQLEPDGGVLTVTNPDPVPLWEFTPEWERLQLQRLLSSSPERVLPDQPSDAPDDVSPCSDDDEFWAQSMMGISVSDPEIATLLIQTDDFTASPQLQRPVAIFGAGAANPDQTGCGAVGAGYGIYVVDLQTGTILRRFVDFKHPDGNFYTFAKGGPSGDPGTLVGSPAVYDSFPGNIATRGFIGDSFGRLFRMDFTNPDPLAWEVSLFFDPEDTSEFGDDVRSAKDSTSGLNGDPFGPASYKPTIALNENREPIVVYGLGEVGDAVPNNQAQAMIALREDQLSGEATLEWFLVLEQGEKLTGAPFIFNGQVFFPTYFVPNEDKCAPGRARIYQLNYLPETGGTAPEGLVDTAAALADSLDFDSANRFWFGPDESALIRGLTLTLGAICSVQGVGTNSQTFVEDAQPQPELIAQTGGVEPASSRTNARGGDLNLATDLNRLVTPIPPPKSEMVPLSWSIISN